ncbi:MAG: hypothetical protein J0I54_20565 [Bosea sp.]|uniref:hypothetical protein n=1 Tax=unclassified Bosea (in: a-proteobacteria) TaxID=2653178 RepID=UPI000967593A|nr:MULTISPECIES: hypothetical protein [unclassified Bosea (in: a-proteobacteria)]MBN9459033.1 hypothetical protein [Bosea sp. (in: a-proteobacteria)]OJV06225.1 MAG: hypothetical protein BGO20_08185 [Bosea sp. 67-29]
MPAPTPMPLDELIRRLGNAAQTEMFAINIMECASARLGRDGIDTDVVAQTRRQGEALGLAHKIAVKLRSNPELVIGLGLQDVVSLGDPA